MIGDATMAMRKYKEASTASKSERLEVRVTPQQKSLMQRAAELSGQSLTAFVAASVQDAAMRTIRENSIITLTAQDSIAFAEALLNPREPNTALRTAFARYNQEPAE
jgi:uncharacterized protein (DUF1778 family)